METLLDLLRPGDIDVARAWCLRHGVELIALPDYYAATVLFTMRDPKTSNTASRVIYQPPGPGPHLITSVLPEMLAEIRGTEAEA